MERKKDEQKDDGRERIGINGNSEMVYLLSLFYDKSAFVGYLMPKPFF